METVAELAVPAVRGRPVGIHIGWLILAAVSLPCIYIPMVTAPFDFADDGCLAYGTPHLSLGQHLERIWSKTVSEFQAAGPFRPVTWAFWEAEANLLPKSVPRRIFRVFWAMLACGSFLWLLGELRMHPVASLSAATLAMWNPYRNEIWMTFGLTEAFAMPVSMAALACAVHATRSRRPAGWDLAGALCVLFALGCKNTFAAVIPAQVILRLIGDGSSLREGWRRHGQRAVLLALMLCLPFAHFAVYKSHPHQLYATHFSWAQIRVLRRALIRAMGPEFLLPALLLMGATYGLHRRKEAAQRTDISEPASTNHLRLPALVAGGLLLVGGLGEYSVMAGAPGRYTMPAVWGADLCFAVLLSTWFSALSSFRRRQLVQIAVGIMLVGGFVVMLGFNYRKQHDAAARARMLWQALEDVERVAVPPARVAFLASPRWDATSPYLSLAEGGHFRWHLQNRGHAKAEVIVYNIDAPPGQSADKIPADTNLVISSMSDPPSGTTWQLVNAYSAYYMAGHCRWHCFLWRKAGYTDLATRQHH